MFWSVEELQKKKVNGHLMTTDGQAIRSSRRDTNSQFISCRTCRAAPAGTQAATAPMRVTFTTTLSHRSILDVRRCLHCGKSTIRVYESEVIELMQSCLVNERDESRGRKKKCHAWTIRAVQPSPDQVHATT